MTKWMRICWWITRHRWIHWTSYGVPVCVICRYNPEVDLEDYLDE